MRISDWSSDVGSSDLQEMAEGAMPIPVFVKSAANSATRVPGTAVFMTSSSDGVPHALLHNLKHNKVLHERIILLTIKIADVPFVREDSLCKLDDLRSEEHTSELQSLMRISYAVFCLKKK